MLGWLTDVEVTRLDEFYPNILEDSSDLKDIWSGTPTGVEETKLSSESVLHQSPERGSCQGSEPSSDTQEST